MNVQLVVNEIFAKDFTYINFFVGFYISYVLFLLIVYDNHTIGMPDLCVTFKMHM